MRLPPHPYLKGNNMTDTITTPDVQERLRVAEAERGDYATELVRTRDALAVEYLETKRTAEESKLKSKQAKRARRKADEAEYLHMMFVGEWFAATRCYARFLIATHHARNVDEATQQITEGTAWGLVEAFVDVWADLEGHDKYALSPHRAAIADMVRDHLKRGDDLDQIPMADLAAPYLPGAAK